MLSVRGIFTKLAALSTSGAVGLVANTSALAAPRVELGLRLYGTGVEESTQSSRVAGTRIDGALHYDFHPRFKTRVRAELRLETGAFSSTYTDEFSPKQVPRLRETSLEYLPIDELSLVAGALDQSIVDSPLLFGDQTFPGLYQRLRIPLGTWALKLDAEQALPTGSATTNLSAPSSGPPFFFFGKAGVEFTPISHVTAEGSIAHFSFQNLGEATAGKSRFWGNTVVGLGPRPQYLFGYRGIALDGRLKASLGRFEPTIGLSWIENADAPGDRNKGFCGMLRLSLLLTPTVRLTPKLDVFKVDSDSTPSAYTNRDWGHTNRVGYAISVELELVRERLLFGTSWIAAEALQPTPYQSNFRELSGFLRTQFEL